MKLRTYLFERQISQHEFAAAIGSSQSAISKYCASQRMPGQRIMRAIIAATQGEVTANDFFDFEAVTR